MNTLDIIDLGALIAVLAGGAVILATAIHVGCIAAARADARRMQAKLTAWVRRAS